MTPSRMGFPDPTSRGPKKDLHLDEDFCSFALRGPPADYRAARGPGTDSEQLEQNTRELQLPRFGRPPCLHLELPHGRLSSLLPRRTRREAPDSHMRTGEATELLVLEDLIHQHVLYILKKNPDVSKLAPKLTFCRAATWRLRVQVTQGAAGHARGVPPGRPRGGRSHNDL